MLFRNVCVVLMLLNIFLFTSKSSQEVICIFDEDAMEVCTSQFYCGPPWSAKEFWANFPCKPTCTRYILQKMSWPWGDPVENMNKFKRMMTSMSQEKNERGVMIGTQMFADRVWRYHVPWIKSHFNGVNIIMLRTDDDVAERLEFMKRVLREMRPLGKTVSQGLLCYVGEPELLRVGQLAKDVDMTYVLIRMLDPSNFRLQDIIYKCLTPVLDHGLPKNKIAVGLILVKFREICKKEKERSTRFTDFATRMTHYARNNGYAGVVVYHLESDDYTGRECGLGKYPFLEAHTGHTIARCAPLEGVGSGAIVVKPIIMMTLISLHLFLP